MTEPRLKWFKFSHRVLAGERVERPFFAAHLVDATPPPGVLSLKPICGDETATVIIDEHEPRGFLLACCSCLARSEAAQCPRS